MGLLRKARGKPLPGECAAASHVRTLSNPAVYAPCPNNASAFLLPDQGLNRARAKASRLRLGKGSVEMTTMDGTL